MTLRDFDTFYRDVYHAEHRHPANVALHVAGTIGGLGFLVVTLASPLPWLALLFPAVHALPGLLGHRLFERNPAVGDLRVLRRDFPGWWFIIANHRLTFELARQALRRG
jgi:hypothetical protein